MFSSGPHTQKIDDWHLLTPSKIIINLGECQSCKYLQKGVEVVAGLLGNKLKCYAICANLY